MFTIFFLIALITSLITLFAELLGVDFTNSLLIHSRNVHSLCINLIISVLVIFLGIIALILSVYYVICAIGIALLMKRSIKLSFLLFLAPLAFIYIVIREITYEILSDYVKSLKAIAICIAFCIICLSAIVS